MGSPAGVQSPQFLHFPFCQSEVKNLYISGNSDSGASVLCGEMGDKDFSEADPGILCSDDLLFDCSTCVSADSWTSRL